MQPQALSLAFPASHHLNLQAFQRWLAPQAPSSLSSLHLHGLLGLLELYTSVLLHMLFPQPGIPSDTRAQRQWWLLCRGSGLWGQVLGQTPLWVLLGSGVIARWLGWAAWGPETHTMSGLAGPRRPLCYRWGHHDSPERARLPLPPALDPWILRTCSFWVKECSEVIQAEVQIPNPFHSMSGTNHLISLGFNIFVGIARMEMMV